MTPELILASASSARKMLLQQAGVPFTVRPADVDETALKNSSAKIGRTPEQTALALAAAKAEVISATAPDALVLGADQILVQDGRLYDKPETLSAAREHLRSFRGRTHQLISAAVMYLAGDEIWRGLDSAHLSVRSFSDAFLDDYLMIEGEIVLTSVGAYRLERMGSQLFDRIDGDHATVLGLPLFPLLEELRNRGILTV